MLFYHKLGINQGVTMKKNKNILKYAKIEARKGKKLTVGSKELKVFVVLFYIFAVYEIMMSMVVMFGNMFTMMEYADKSTQTMILAYNQERMHLITLVIAICLMIAAFVLLKFKKVIPFIVCVSANCVVIFSVFLKASLENDIKNGGQMGFWGPFGIPCLLCLALALFITVVHIIDARRVNAEYDKLISKLYDKMSANTENNVGIDDFDEILNSYRGETEEDLSVPKCPICGSTNLKKLSVINRGISFGFFGLASNKINKTYECQKCKVTF